MDVPSSGRRPIGLRELEPRRAIVMVADVAHEIGSPSHVSVVTMAGKTALAASRWRGRRVTLEPQTPAD